MPASPKKSMESASKDTEPEAQDAPISTKNIAALKTSATHSALRKRGSTVGVAQVWLEQQ